MDVASVRETKGRFYARLRNEYGIRTDVLLLDVRTRRAAKLEASRLEEKAKRVRLGIDLPDASMTLAELWAIYAKAKSRKPSLKADKSRWKNHVAKALGDRPLHLIRPSDVEDLLKEIETKRGLTGNTAEKVRMLIAALFTYAIRKKRCFRGENPARAADKPVIVVKPKFELEPHHVQPILDAVDERWRNIFAASVYTGARAGELKPVRLDDVNLTKPPLGMLLWKSNERDVTKGGRNRWVPIPAAGLPYFKDAIRQARAIYGALPQHQQPAPSEELLFPSDRGQQLRVDLRLAERMREACIRVGLIKHFELGCETCDAGPFERRDGSVELCERCRTPMTVTPVAVDLVFHSLRATAASTVQAMTGDMRQAQRLLGHADLRTTEMYLAKNRQAFAAGSVSLDFSSHNFPTLNPNKSVSGNSSPNETKRPPREDS